MQEVGVYDTDDENNVDGSKRRGYGDHIFFISHVGVISLFKVLRIYCLRGSSMSGPPVWHAAKFGTLKDLKDRIDEGCDMNEQGGDNGSTTSPLHEAVLNNDAAKVMLLVRNDVDLFAKNRRGRYSDRTPEYVAWELWEKDRGPGSTPSSVYDLLELAQLNEKLMRRYERMRDLYLGLQEEQVMKLRVPGTDLQAFRLLES